MAKPKVASDWLAGCAGCHMSFLDIDERIAQLVELVDLRATPITDLKEPDKDGVVVGILEGGSWLRWVIAQYLAAFPPCAISSPSKIL